MLPGGIGKSVTASGGIINAFSGAVKLGTSANNQHFTLEFGGLGKETCISLASSDWGTEGLVKMTVNTTSHNQQDLPIKATKAVSECQMANSTNKILWEYY